MKPHIWRRFAPVAVLGVAAALGLGAIAIAQDWTSAPTRELFSEKITNFDLIIFDRYQNRGILPPIYYDNIARYVANGGALLVASGDDYAQAASPYRTALAPVLPAAPSGRVIEQPFKARITVDGHKHPVTRNLPGIGEADREPDWGRWFRQVETNVLRGRTLMSGVQERPLLVLDRVGRGRVALLLSDHAWLWARGYDGGGPHTDLLRRTAHWLMKEPDLEEERLLADARGLKLTIERRSMETSVPPVSIQSPGGESSEVQLEPAGDAVWRTRRPAITISSPVCGLRPLRGCFTATTKFPNPEIFTFSPPSRRRFISSKTASTTSVASFLEHPTRS